MILSAPVELPAQQFVTATGTHTSLPAITLSKLVFRFIDDPTRKECVAQIIGFINPLVLWSGDAYTEAGDYTQADVENRLLELLGANPAQVLNALRVPVQVPPPERTTMPQIPR